MMLRIALAEVKHLCIDTSASCSQNASCSSIVAACGMTCADTNATSTAPVSSRFSTFLYSFGKLSRKATISASSFLNSGLHETCGQHYSNECLVGEIPDCNLRVWYICYSLLLTSAKAPCSFDDIRAQRPRCRSQERAYPSQKDDALILQIDCIDEWESIGGEEGR